VAIHAASMMFAFEQGMTYKMHSLNP